MNKTNTATEKNVANSNNIIRIFTILSILVVLVGVIIAIPIVYSKGRGTFVSSVLSNVSSKDYLLNECTTTAPLLLTNVDALAFYNNSQPFPFRYYNYLYRPSVILNTMYIIFGFNNDDSSWSLDEINVNDTTSNEDVSSDGGFESNYLTKYYTRCVLSKTRSSTGDILFDNPYEGDFYYNDQTTVGMAYLIQKLTITGGRYYNITFYLENRGFTNNTFLFAIGYVKN